MSIYPTPTDAALPGSGIVATVVGQLIAQNQAPQVYRDSFGKGAKFLPAPVNQALMGLTAAQINAGIPPVLAPTIPPPASSPMQTPVLPGGGNLSLLDDGFSAGNIASILTPIANVATAYFNSRSMQSMVAPAAGAMPAMGALPPVAGGVLRALPGAVAAGGAVVARSAGALMRGATTWCRRNPAWCSTVGGTAAVAAMIGDGRLPMPRRRRARGISGRDLRSFRRVHNILARFCTPKARIKKAC